MLYTCPYIDRKDINIKRVEGTCNWFTNHPRFKYWIESESSRLLWVSADPGSGKSVLLKYLVDEVVKPSTNKIVCYFFFKEGFEDSDNATDAICALLRQLLLQRPELMQGSLIGKLERDAKYLVQSFGELWRAFMISAAKLVDCQIICILDALDECKENKLLINALNEFYLSDSGMPT